MGGGGVIGQPFVQFCFRRFTPSVVFSVSAYFPLMDIDIEKEKGTALLDADVEEVTRSKVSRSSGPHALLHRLFAQLYLRSWVRRGGYRSPDD